jgi:hypothetical protein
VPDTIASKTILASAASSQVSSPGVPSGGAKEGPNTKDERSDGGGSNRTTSLHVSREVTPVLLQVKSLLQNIDQGRCREKRDRYADGNRG